MNSDFRKFQKYSELNLIFFHDIYKIKLVSLISNFASIEEYTNA